MTIKDMRQQLATMLTPAVGDSEAKAMADTIIQDIKGCSSTDLVVNSHRELLPETEKRMLDAAQQVVNGKPLQYVLGTAHFHGRQFGVNNSTLIPRPETSQLVDIIEKDVNGKSDLSVLDIGTGSGCIAISLALDLPFSAVTAIDNSPSALDRAIANAKELHSRVNFIKADALHLDESPIKGQQFDIIVSNPPYVLMSEKKDMDKRVVDYEPSTALFVPDNDPLLFYSPVIAYAAKALTDGGTLYLECNPLSIAQVEKAAINAGLVAHTQFDYKGVARFVIATKS